MIKKTLMLAAVIGMLFTANTVFGATIDITAVSKSGNPGDTNIEIPISVGSVTGLGVISADINFTYDSTRLTYASASLTGTIIESWNRSINSSTPGLVRIALFTPDYACSGSGSLIKLYFNVNAQASGGASNLTLSSVQFGPATNTPVIHNGTFTVNATNRAPVLDLIGPKSVNEGSSLIFNISATDPDGDTLTYSTGTLPAGAIFNSSTRAFSWTPDYTQAGTYTVHFAVSDNKGGTDSEDVTVTVNNTNRAPVASDQSVTTPRNTAKAITLVATDLDQNTLTYTIVANPSHGTLSGTGASRTYTPATDYAGSDSFTFKANDGTADSNTATVSIIVQATNRAPVASGNISVTTPEDTTKVITLAATDPDGDALTYSIVAAAQHGSLSVVSGANVTYTPAANYNGADSFTFKANDGKVDSNIATVPITVIAVNDAPVASSQSITTNENAAKAITLAATDADGDTLTYAIVANPSHGILSGTGASRTYTPAANYSGADSFTFKANDGTVDSNTAAVSITVNPLTYTLTVTGANNGSVIKSPDQATYNEGTTVTLTANPASGYKFTGWSGDLTGTGNPATIVMNSNKTVAANFVANTYKLTISQDGQGQVTPSVGIYTYNSGTQVTLSATVGSGYKFTGWSGDASGTANPLTITMDKDKSIMVVFQANLTAATGSGSAKQGDTAIAIPISVGNLDLRKITAVDLVLTYNKDLLQATAVQKGAVTSNWSMSANTSVAGEVRIALFSTVDLVGGGELAKIIFNVKPTAAVGTTPLNLTTANFNAIPAENLINGNFTILAKPNQPPVATSQSITTNEDTAKAITLAATDADGNPLNYSIVAAAQHGSLSAISGANVTYTPAANYSGADSFTFKANDGTVDSNTATVSITVTAVNHAPVASDQSVTTPRNTAKAITLVATDLDQNTLTYTIVANPSHGTLSGTGASRTYTPATDYAGSDSFTFKANDGTADSNTATVSIIVQATNRAPVLNQIGNKSVNETQKLQFTLSATDPDGDPITFLSSDLPRGAMLAGTTFSWTPDYDQAGNYKVTFTVKDDKGLMDSEDITITVNNVNRPPQAKDQSVTTNENAAKVITLTGADADNDVLTYAIVTGPTHGSLSAISGVNVTYAPAANYNGADSFTFKVNDGKVDSYFATVSITVNPQTYTLAVITGNNGSVTKSPDQATYNAGVSVSLAANPATGYHFLNWSGDLTGTANPATIIMSSNKTVTANFAINTYAITASAGIGGSISPSGSVSVNYGASQEFTITANAEYSINRVLVDGSAVTLTSGSKYTLTNITANHTIAASFIQEKQKQFELTIYSGYGSITKKVNGVITKATSFAPGTKVMISVNPIPGYSFKGWSGDIVSKARIIMVTMDSNITITANFIPQQYRLYTYAHNGKITRSPNQKTYTYGQKVQLIAVPDAGYVLKGWWGYAKGSFNPVTITMDSNKGVVAIFTKRINSR